MSPADHANAAGQWQRALGGLLFTPVVVGLAALVLPGIHVGADLAAMIVFGGTALTTVTALAIAATSGASSVVRLAIATTAAVALGGFAWAGVDSITAAVGVDAALVAAAWGIGTSIGARIEDPGHLLPACVVVACADAISIVSRFGPTHAVAESDRALSIVAVAFPVPGTSGLAPALGVGDLVFIAIVLGAVVAHRLSIVRAAMSCLIGTLVAGAGSAVLGTAVPALVPIGAAVVIGLPAARKLRQKDRRVATVAMAIAVSVAAATTLAQLVRPATDDVAK